MPTSRNDITGDELVTGSASDAYRTGWDRIFGTKKVMKNKIEHSTEVKITPDFPIAYLLEIEEHDWSGIEIGGYYAFKTEECAQAFITEQYSDRDSPVPSYYERYNQLGWFSLSPEHFEMLKSSIRPYIYLNSLV